MLVKDIMSKDVVSLDSKDSIERAAQMMKQFDVGSIPVCNEKRLVGIITDRDITLNSVASGKNPTEQQISDVMTSHLITGNPNMDVQDVAKIMSREQIRRLPIVENNSLVGMISLGDISVEPALQHNAEDALSSISEPGTNNHF
ncbi:MULTISPECIES: CBS domain-containing protein [Clostridium]|uniref:CBS domain-containing protein n=1 Tax=Clostridium cibarium TaxID=2762247 RepID=A0ABR8PX42_9CLOT|nr:MULTISPECIES: CBS domain-containing protein [Clostridium]MBD7912748.1 CBS domain-containing protein [Clostridium cibarium]